jgi:hypothetical protein
MPTSPRSLAFLMLALATMGPAVAGAHPPDDGDRPHHPPPPDWSTAEKTQWELLEKELARSVKLTEEACETNVPASFDRETFRGNLVAPGKTGLAASPWWQNANDSVATLRKLCLATPAFKGVVKAKLMRVVIQHAGEGRQHDFAAATIYAVVDRAATPAAWQAKYEQFVSSKLQTAPSPRR